ncbi:MAG: nucleoside deaminase [Deltaproteobacteria bacterium]|nr:nucleoside deaminase [Deltaproteobacteria bacterium]
MPEPSFNLNLPSWIKDYMPPKEKVFPTMQERMKFVIELSRLNIEQGTGGPFGAAVFDIENDRLVSPGVNLVSSLNCSVFHAEIVAIMGAQKIIGSYDLGGDDVPAMELVASTEPCAMCFGAVPWSGVRRLVCGARDGDARVIGFDEGPKMSSWISALESRGIEVFHDICRDEAVQVLKKYDQMGGVIYNSRQGG